MLVVERRVGQQFMVGTAVMAVKRVFGEFHDRCHLCIVENPDNLPVNLDVGFLPPRGNPKRESLNRRRNRM